MIHKMNKIQFSIYPVNLVNPVEQFFLKHDSQDEHDSILNSDPVNPVDPVQDFFRHDSQDEQDSILNSDPVNPVNPVQDSF